MRAGGEEHGSQDLMRGQDFTGPWAYNEPGIVPGRYLAAWGKNAAHCKGTKEEQMLHVLA